MRRRLAFTVTLLAVLLPAAGAQAAFFGGEAIDGPGPDVRSVGGVDLSRDGTGVVAYVRRDAGVDHIFVSRLVGGAWQAPERVDGGLDGAGSSPVAAAADGGRLAVVFVNAGTVYAAVHEAGAASWLPPQPLAAGGESPSVDLSVNGTGYATFTVAGDVRAARLDRLATAFTGIDAPLDIDPASIAGVGAGRSRVAISADATGVAVWGENGRVYVRRLYRNTVSTAATDVTAGVVDGHVGRGADSPSIDIEDDSSYAWISYRGLFDDAGAVRARSVARRLRGSRLEDPVLVDGLGWGADGALAPRIDINGRGAGIATTGTLGGGATAAVIKDDVFGPGVGIGGTGVPSNPVGAVSESNARVAAWFSNGDGAVHARFYDDRDDLRAVPYPGPDTVVSSPDFGPADPSAGLEISTDRTGDFAMAFVQGTGDQRRLVAAVYDRVPGSFATSSASRWRNLSRAPLSWAAPTDQWGPLTYSVIIDGVQVGQTQDTRIVIPSGAAPDGIHPWRVVATDRRGQAVRTRVRNLRVDSRPPEVSFSVRRKRRVVTVAAKAADALPPGGRASGVSYVRIDFGDGSGFVTARKATHVYGRLGAFTLRVSATDAAGNAGVVTRRIHIGGG
jgi:hypothetical protein